ncbi:hypothetical protein [Cupriavidus sp. YAF13]|uniref:hypothetical protein n=1 Tax=Cupriavidus sp. YAF13 TaxID=3233075 RepID=UPI003F924AA3
MRTSSLAAGGLLTALISGCSIFTPPARLHELDSSKNYWFDYDASRRGSFFAHSSAGTSSPSPTSCAEPAPDVALSFATSLDAKLSSANITPQAKGDLAVSAVKLAERSQMIQFSREALFRVCEVAQNNRLSAEQIVGLYQKIIDTALRLGSDKALENDAKLIAERIEEKKSENLIAAAKRDEAAAALAATTDEQERTKLRADVTAQNEKIRQQGLQMASLAEQLLAAVNTKKLELKDTEKAANLAKAAGEGAGSSPGSVQAPAPSAQATVAVK